MSGKQPRDGGRASMLLPTKLILMSVYDLPRRPGKPTVIDDAVETSSKKTAYKVSLTQHV